MYLETAIRPLTLLPEWVAAGGYRFTRYPGDRAGGRWDQAVSKIFNRRPEGRAIATFLDSAGCIFRSESSGCDLPAGSRLCLQFGFSPGSAAAASDRHGLSIAEFDALHDLAVG